MKKDTGSEGGFRWITVLRSVRMAEIHTTMREVVVRVHLELLEDIERNLPGVLADWDSEFLHDMRVAVRRTRSGLNLAKKVLPDDVTERFSTVFRFLGSVTGPTRDLDVYLLRRKAYVKRLVPPLQAGLSLFFADLEDRRRAEHERMVEILGAAAIGKELDAWRRILQNSDAESASRADQPAVDRAGRIISRHLRQVLSRGRTMHAETADAEVHRLRIQCKKLRYAIEFFRGLYPEQEVRFLLRHLKKLQDVLGDFNDLTVQQEMLRDTLRQLSGGDPGHLEQAASLGALMQSLAEEQQELRSHCIEAFSQFDDNAVTGRFAALFQTEEHHS